MFTPGKNYGLWIQPGRLCFCASDWEDVTTFQDLEVSKQHLSFLNTTDNMRYYFDACGNNGNMWEFISCSIPTDASKYMYHLERWKGRTVAVTVDKTTMEVKLESVGNKKETIVFHDIAYIMENIDSDFRETIKFKTKGPNAVSVSLIKPKHFSDIYLVTNLEY